MISLNIEIDERLEFLMGDYLEQHPEQFPDRAILEQHPEMFYSQIIVQALASYLLPPTPGGRK